MKICFKFFSSLKNIGFKIAATAGFFLFFSCSHDYNQVLMEEEISGKIPNAVIVNFKEISVKKGKAAYSIEAKKAELFDKKNLTSVKGLKFYEYGKDNEEVTATEGEVGAADFYSVSENIDFKENFKIHSVQNGYYIEGESVFWDNGARRLSSGEETEVVIGRDNGSFIKGKGFASSARDKSFYFGNGVEGRYVSEDDEKEENQPENQEQAQAEDTSL